MKIMSMLAEPTCNISLTLSEWSFANPDTHNLLSRFSFENDPVARLTAERLTQEGQIRLIETTGGLEIQTTSVVGSIRLGQLSLTILPKLDGLPLLRLLQFAYSLRNLDLFDLEAFSARRLSFQDLLILQLSMEVEELISRGLLRRYSRIDKELSSPKGRLDFNTLARRGNWGGPTIPCVTHMRVENCLHNRVLLSGLLLAAQLTSDLALRTRVRGLAKLLIDHVESISLNSQVLKRIERETNRQSEVYIPAMKLIALLMGEIGQEQLGEARPLRLNGFLFDMNHFFQALLSKLLNGYLDHYEVEDEHVLKGFLAYVPGYELPYRHDPLPRPDFAIFQKGKVISLLDAKYRDLWRDGLPREMLYQLVVYALSQPERRKATIIYPSMNNTAKDAVIQINEPVHGTPNGYVILRPVNLLTLERNIRENNLRNIRSMAYELVFGNEDYKY